MTRTHLAALSAAAALAIGCAKQDAGSAARTDTGGPSAAQTATTAAALDTGTAAARAAAGPNAQTASLPQAEQANPATTTAAATMRAPTSTPSTATRSQASGIAPSGRTTATAGGGVVTRPPAGGGASVGAEGAAQRTAAGATPSAAAGAQRGAPANAQAAAANADVRVNRFMTYNAGEKTVSLDIFAAFNNQQGGFNFNGGSNGSQTITVPAGWTVRMHVVNKDAIPHSAIVINDQHPLPQAPSDPAIPRAYSAHVNDGLPPVNGSDDVVFKASKPGNYLIDCGVPGHGQSGMWIHFNVSADAQAPTYQM